MIWFFFFQAEDGIRYLVRSRGLGDVYKRQAQDVGVSTQPLAPRLKAGHDYPANDAERRASVSYTHLTLPTSDLV